MLSYDFRTQVVSVQVKYDPICYVSCMHFPIPCGMHMSFDSAIGLHASGWHLASMCEFGF